MDKNSIIDICQIVSVSGAEEGIRNYIINQIKDYADDYRTDALGNLIAHKKGLGPKMMYAAHMDQIGFMVNFIDDEGNLRFSTIGGFNPNNIYNQRVVFENGTVGVIRPERLDDPKDFALDKLYIDIGAANKEEAAKLVSIGDMCAYKAETYVDKDKIISPALDDRIGCLILIEALKALKSPAFDAYFVFSVQEEVGLRGAKTSAYAIEPDYGVAFDVCTCFGTPKALKFPSKMGGGAAIKIKDASLICHPAMVKHIEKTAKDNNIKYQMEIMAQGGTDAGAIHINKSGAPAGGISVPTRYIHSDNEMCSIADVEAAIALAVKIMETPIEGF